MWGDVLALFSPVAIILAALAVVPIGVGMASGTIATRSPPALDWLDRALSFVLLVPSGYLAFAANASDVHDSMETGAPSGIGSLPVWGLSKLLLALWWMFAADRFGEFIGFKFLRQKSELLWSTADLIRGRPHTSARLLGRGRVRQP